MSPSTIRTLATAFIGLTVQACGDGSATPQASPAVSEPWTLADVRADTSDGLRILVLHDMEGLSGQNDPRSFNFGTPQYPQGQQLLAADINAVVEGLYAGGATEVHVVDGHGSGNPEPDVRRDLLDKRAQQILRDSTFDSYFDLVAPRAYDGVAVVGMHAKTGSGGFASHTYTIGIGFEIHGQSITETELVGLSWGRENIPVIFGSGDDRLAKDLETMPWIEFVTVKRATAADSAELRPVEEARGEMRARAQKAMENLRAGRAKAMRVALPVRAAIHTVHPADISVLEGVPVINYSDNRVTFETAELNGAYRGLVKLVGIATRSYSRLLGEELRSRKEGAAINAAYGDRLMQRWFDVESGRWTVPSPRAPQPGTKFHGYR
jgi:D-amino peptidase